jgi:hypothetical protein|tara:strand:- start:103 stop:711 length:609 start_codon:yes stop_codon:yes gene_type:complete
MIRTSKDTTPSDKQNQLLLNEIQQLHENYKCSDHSVENTVSYLNSVKVVEQLNITFSALKDQLDSRLWHPILKKSEGSNTKNISSSHLNKIFNFFGVYEIAILDENGIIKHIQIVKHWLYGGQSGDSTYKEEGDVGTSCANRLSNHGDKILGRGKISSSEEEWQKYDWTKVYCRAIRVDKRIARTFESYIIDQRNPILNRQP